MEFFRLPLEEKQKYQMAPGTVQGYGQAFVFSEHQKLDWCNMFALGVIPDSIRNTLLWPKKPTNFRWVFGCSFSNTVPIVLTIQYLSTIHLPFFFSFLQQYCGDLLKRSKKALPESIEVHSFRPWP